jgi:hypothetical protein
MQGCTLDQKIDNLAGRAGTGGGQLQKSICQMYRTSLASSGWMAVAGICRIIIQGNTLVTIVGHIGASHETILEGETGAFCHEGGQWRSLFRPQSQARAEE